MPLLTFDQAKAQLKIDGDELDDVVRPLYLAAIKSAADYLGRPIPWVVIPEDGGNPVEAPLDSVNAAIVIELKALYLPAEIAPEVRGRAFRALLTADRIGMGV